MVANIMMPSGLNPDAHMRCAIIALLSKANVVVYELAVLDCCRGTVAVLSARVKSLAIFGCCVSAMKLPLVRQY